MPLLDPTPPPPGHRDWYAWEAVRAIPRLVLMVDKNPCSPTYGCFDRSYWHYRTMDFPCGMNQEFVLPLALASKLEWAGNPYRDAPRLRELALAGIDFAAKSAHADGSCDDYFPFERALGAVTFSLYAMSEAMLELDDRDPARLEFIARRAEWLATHNETGQLANHQAFAALALYNAFILTGEQRLRDASDKFRDLTLSWQDEEGWFQEYEGADPGYHSCSISFLGKLWRKSGDESLLGPLEAAVEFAWWFAHPDGSYGGEYGSRNTYHFYPHGFEVMAPRSAKAGQIAQAYLLRGLPNRRRYFNDDDRMAAHYVYDWMQAWRDHAPDREAPVELPPTRQTRWFPNAKLFVVRDPAYHAVAAANKGGVFKATTPDGPMASDTGLVGELEDGRVVVAHIVADNRVEVDEQAGGLEVSGVFQRRRQPLPTPWRQIAFRLMNLTIGRFSANLVRATLQRILITGKRPLPIRFRRVLRFGADGIEVVDEVRLRGGVRFRRLMASTDATSIYVANSNVYQDSVLLPWTPVEEDAVEKLNTTGKLRLRRAIPAGEAAR